MSGLRTFFLAQMRKTRSSVTCSNFQSIRNYVAKNYVSGDMIEKATCLCRAYLPGAWKKIIKNDIEVTRVSGGLSNWLYHVKLLNTPTETMPREVLLRLYGESHADCNKQLLIQESVIFALLSERKLGPRLYGVFTGGRIEEYIPARPLYVDELSDPTMSLLIAEKMAAIHLLRMPITKEPGFLWDTINRWINNIGDLGSIEHGNPILKVLLKNDLYAEIKWLRGYLSKFHCPVVFCHNDFQEGNILMRTDDVSAQSTIPSLMIIDYEYCAYNYRSFEIANHFIEWIFDYKISEYPYYKICKDNYPSFEQQKTFINHYLSKVGSNEMTEKVIEEVKYFTLASHLFWALWAILYGKVSKITFGYWDYAADRLQLYYSLKSQLLSNGSKCVLRRRPHSNPD